MMKNAAHPWYRPRGYAHFDRPVGQLEAERLATNPKLVASHAFYPFLRYVVETRKVERDRKTRRVAYKDPKKRQISYAAHSDAHIYSYYAHLLSKPYEDRLQGAGLEASIIAFRSLRKSNVDFANDAFETIKGLGECVAFATDISGFFDNLDHQHLKAAWAATLGCAVLPKDHYAVFKSLTKYAYAMLDDVLKVLGISKHNPPRSPSRLCSPGDFRVKVRGAGLVQRHAEKKGIPQGSPISALLSNIYLFDFDRQLHKEIVDRGGCYLRYCDDILCIVPTAYGSELSDIVGGLIKRFKLDINEKKTETSHFSRSGDRLLADRPLQYLGFTFDGERKLIRSAAFAKFSEKMRRGVNLAKKTTEKYNKLQAKTSRIWRQSLYERYSHIGRRNFISYGLRASEKMQSPAIRKQLRPLWGRLQLRIAKADAEL